MYVWHMMLHPVCRHMMSTPCGHMMRTLRHLPRLLGINLVQTIPSCQAYYSHQYCSAHSSLSIDCLPLLDMVQFDSSVLNENKRRHNFGMVKWQIRWNWIIIIMFKVLLTFWSTKLHHPPCYMWVEEFQPHQPHCCLQAAGPLHSFQTLIDF